MSETIEHREAGDRGHARGEHRRAGRAVGALAAPSRGPVAAGALGAVALGQQHAELGRDRDDQRAERRPTSGSAGCARREQHERRPAGGQRDRDQRHERARARRRKATSSTSATASRPGTSSEQRAARARTTAALASAASTGRPASCGVHARRAGAARGASRRCTCFWRSSGISRMPKASVAVRRSARDDALGEVRRARRRAAPSICAASGARAAAAANRSGSENAGHSSALPQPRLSV